MDSAFNQYHIAEIFSRSIAVAILEYKSSSLETFLIINEVLNVKIFLLKTKNFLKNLVNQSREYLRDCLREHWCHSHREQNNHWSQYMSNFVIPPSPPPPITPHPLTTPTPPPSIFPPHPYYFLDKEPCVKKNTEGSLANQNLDIMNLKWLLLQARWKKKSKWKIYYSPFKIVLDYKL